MRSATGVARGIGWPSPQCRVRAPNVGSRMRCINERCIRRPSKGVCVGKIAAASIEEL